MPDRPAHRDHFQTPRDLYECIAIEIESIYLLTSVNSPYLVANSANSDLRELSWDLDELRPIVKVNILIGANSQNDWITSGNRIHSDL